MKEKSKKDYLMIAWLLCLVVYLITQALSHPSLISLLWVVSAIMMLVLEIGK